MAFEYDEMADTVREMIGEILRNYGKRVPERGEFPDLRVGRPAQFGDPTVSLPGRVELIVMHMDARLDPQFDLMRFVSVQVMKSREGGYASLTCFHGTAEEVRKQLEEQGQEPDFLIDRIWELSEGLPEETNPDLWR